MLSRALHKILTFSCICNVKKRISEKSTKQNQVQTKLVESIELYMMKKKYGSGIHLESREICRNLVEHLSILFEKISTHTTNSCKEDKTLMFDDLTLKAKKKKKNSWRQNKPLYEMPSSVSRGIIGGAYEGPFGCTFI